VKTIYYLPILGVNIGALKYFFSSIGYSLKEIDSNNEYDYDKLILLIPGVGNFKHHLDAIKSLEVEELIFRAKKLITICAGFQVLCRYSSESDSKGLGLLDYDVLSINSLTSGSVVVNTGQMECSDGNRYFFNHSYGVLFDQSISGAYKINIIGRDFVSHIISKKKSSLHCQFHPELSGANGIRLIKDFLN
jgi:imidazole glycerol-phosphate synthase subunit HisH